MDFFTLKLTLNSCALLVGIGKFVGTTTFFKNTDLFYYSDA
ncbi:hypothetical protein LEP1GSC173_1491 [Leptospira interrogans str. HAI1594]|uniref:Uncharacterized protein n=3 Tax=Leptospira interrogans TaxID=173 RepID=A0A0E2D3Y9_LEPIR|nr:hypothetical protein [Leptospira interrogans]EKO24188.1 hypothetical protein LEP1GSC104_2629 [Leptospira interrogans str. UI 12621]EKO87615.1 hypothetical protein LEP1GSC009_2161 [Leptospira interrogans serovar Grippotyphosa str. Andaman]EKP22858.1 hypothetical protein LEP1GSC117_2969 [Leptospira interrogans serovar Icterohaemorrhagiae str. Verdun LP]EKP75869.1 hypothetical protein LEP1GSC173_1491 [Leptospira interrogans str. HAI1594]EKP87585.1 hypothetical protein LEP1GSC020_1786 [Leptospi